MAQLVSVLAAFLAGAVAWSAFAGRASRREALGVAAGCGFVVFFVVAILALASSRPDTAVLDVPEIDRWRFFDVLWPAHVVAYIAGGFAVAMTSGRLGDLRHEIAADPEAGLARFAALALGSFAAANMVSSIGHRVDVAVRSGWRNADTLGGVAFVAFGFMFWAGVLSRAAKPPPPSPPA